MSMPIDLVLVRHGESEGNLAKRRSLKGDDSTFTDDFSQRLGIYYRLTDLGRDQAREAGEWMRTNIGEHFDRYYVSEYVRAKETAAHLDLPEAQWMCEFYLREREHGDMEVMPEKVRNEKFAASIQKKILDPFFWIPPNGESMAQLCERIDRVLGTLQRECADMRVIVVCHGEVMWGFRQRLEKMSMQRYRELDASKHPYNRMHNCQVLHYTRRDPLKGTVQPYYMWMRSVCPTNVTLSSNVWQPIVRNKFSNETLLAQVDLVKQLVN
jgi:NAD+ kinase